MLFLSTSHSILYLWSKWQHLSFFFFLKLYYLKNTFTYLMCTRRFWHHSKVYLTFCWIINTWSKIDYQITTAFYLVYLYENYRLNFFAKYNVGNGINEQTLKNLFVLWKRFNYSTDNYSQNYSTIFLPLLDTLPNITCHTC